MELITTLLAVIAIILLILLYFIKKAKKSKKHKEGLEALKKIKGTSKKVETPEESLSHLNKLALDFFKNYLKIKHEITFREIAEILKVKRENHLAEFCDKMEYSLYSGKNVSKKDALSLIEEFIEITKHHKITSITSPKKEKSEKVKEKP